MTDTRRIPPVELSEIPEDLKIPSKWFTAPESESLEMFERSAKLANVQRVLARNPNLMKRWMGFAHYLLNETNLTIRDRELAILRTSFLGKFDYEWGQHVQIARNAADFSDKDFRGLIQGPDDAHWNDKDASLLQSVDELFSEYEISRSTWSELTRFYSVPEAMDLVFTVGNYTMLGMAVRSFDVELDEGLQPIPVY